MTIESGTSGVGVMAGKSLVMDTVTGPGTLEQIQRTLDLLWLHEAASDAARIQIELAACEIGANIVQHAANGRPVRMRMLAEVCGPEVRVNFTDDGGAAPIDLDAVSMPSELVEQGRGLALAAAVLDELAFQRDGEVNQWTLVRRLCD